MFRILLFLLLSTPILANEETELFVIGTMHNDASKFKANDLFELLMDLKPDLILFERDSSMLTKDFWFPERKDPELEERAVTQLRKHHVFVMRPYDYEGRNKYKKEHKFKENSKNLSNAIKELRDFGKLSEANQIRLQAIEEITKAMLSLGDEPARIFNSPSASAVVELRKNTLYRNYTEIIASTPELSSYHEHWQRVKSFWIARNNAMVSNIIEYTKEFKGKRIVVLAGFSHKYFLMEKLRESKGYKLMEFWQT